MKKNNIPVLHLIGVILLTALINVSANAAVNPYAQDKDFITSPIKIYVKPAYTLTKPILPDNDTVQSSEPSGGRLSIGFIKPIIPSFGWGLEGGYGYYGKTTIGSQTTSFNSTASTNIQTVVDNSNTKNYQGLDVDALLWWNYSQFSFFGKLGIINLTQQSKLQSNNTTTIVNGSIDSFRSTLPYQFQQTQMNILGGIGADYMLFNHFAIGCEYNFVNGGVSVYPINNLQFYTRLTFG